jgi:tetratricopeptide (TPR) repeat protein
MGKAFSSVAPILVGMMLASPSAGAAQGAPGQQTPGEAEALIGQVNAAMAAKQWQQAVDALGTLIALDPRWEYFQQLGDALANLGRYDDAVGAYGKGLAGEQADRKTPGGRTDAAQSQLLIRKGNAFLKLKRTEDAITAYSQAAKSSPTPGTAWFNLCAVEYNQGLTDRAIVACNAAIAADPTKADAYFIKGSALYGNGTLDKNNNFVLPAGTLEALRKYLQLAPSGAHADDVRAMIEAQKEPIKP